MTRIMKPKSTPPFLVPLLALVFHAPLVLAQEPATRTPEEPSAPQLPPPDASWFPFTTGGANGVPYDLSFLNKDANGDYIPAGAHGFVSVKGGDFVFEDGTPVRFWGMNACAGGALGGRERAAEITEQMARCGANLVRLHHLDSWFKPIVDYDHPDGTTQNLDPESMRLLDAFIFEAKKRGIYINLDPWVQRHFTEADGVAGYNRERGVKNFNLHPFIYFDARMQELIRKQWRDVWNHVNEFTGTAYKDEPAIAMTQVINEGLLYNFKGVTQPVYQERLRSLYDDWARENKGLPWAGANVLTQNYGRNNIAFLMWLHDRFYAGSRDFLRSNGVRVPMNSNNWGLWPWVLASQAQGEVMDRHFYYGGDALGPGRGLGGNWLNHAPGRPETPFGKFAAWSVPGKAFVSSECGHHFPKTYRAAYLPGLAAMAAFQGWDGFMGFAFAQREEANPTLHAFGWESDPVVLSAFAAGALIFRRADVQPAKETVIYALSEDEIYNPRWNNADLFWNLPGYNLLVEQHRVMTALPGDDPAKYRAARVVAEKDLKSMPEGTTAVRSDTGELWRDWNLGIGAIDTPRTQAAYGRLGAAAPEWKTRDCAFQTQEPFAVLSASSLTDAPLAESPRILVIAMAFSKDTGMELGAGGVTTKGKPPVLAAGVTATLLLKTTQSKLVLHPLAANGQRKPGIPVAVRAGIATLPLAPAHETICYELLAP